MEDFHIFLLKPSFGDHVDRHHYSTASESVKCLLSSKEREGGGDRLGGVAPGKLAAARDRGGMVAKSEPCSIHLQHLALTPSQVSLLHWGTGGGLAALCSALSLQAERKRNKLCLSLSCWGVRRRTLEPGGPLHGTNQRLSLPLLSSPSPRLHSSYIQECCMVQISLSLALSHSFHRREARLGLLYILVVSLSIFNFLSQHPWDLSFSFLCCKSPDSRLLLSLVWQSHCKYPVPVLHLALTTARCCVVRLFCGRKG